MEVGKITRWCRVVSEAIVTQRGKGKQGNSMRGRKLFQFFEPVLVLSAVVLRAVPHGVVSRGWWLVDWIPGALGAGLRYIFALRLCRACGKNVLIGRNVEIMNWGNLSIGSNVSIHRFCYLDALGGIAIGNDVSIAHATSVLSFEHAWSDGLKPIRDNPLIPEPIVIANDVWIGAGVRVLAGVNIPSRVVVAAGAVVTGPLVGGRVYGGVPAREIRVLSQTKAIG